MKSEFLKAWERETENLREYFIATYFGYDGAVIEHWWVADEIGGVLHVNDHFFNLSDIVDYIRYDYSAEQMFAHYQYSLDCHNHSVTPINVKNWLKLRKNVA